MKQNPYCEASQNCLPLTGHEGSLAMRFTTRLRWLSWACWIQPTTHNLKPHLPNNKIQFNIILPSMSSSSEWSLPFRLSNHCVPFSHLLRAQYTTSPAQLPWFYRSNFGEQCKSWTSSNAMLSIFPSLLPSWIQIHVSAPCSQTPSFHALPLTWKTKLSTRTKQQVKLQFRTGYWYGVVSYKESHALWTFSDLLWVPIWVRNRSANHSTTTSGELHKRRKICSLTAKLSDY
jgi:hypothetical protein